MRDRLRSSRGGIGDTSRPGTPTRKSGSVDRHDIIGIIAAFRHRRDAGGEHQRIRCEAEIGSEAVADRQGVVVGNIDPEAGFADDQRTRQKARW